VAVKDTLEASVDMKAVLGGHFAVFVSDVNYLVVSDAGFWVGKGSNTFEELCLIRKGKTSLYCHVYICFE